MAYSLPAPLSKTRDTALQKSCDFSYAGLKSAVRQLLETKLPAAKRAELGDEATNTELANVAAAFQRVAVAHLSERTARAIEWAKLAQPSLTCLVVAGGVAANQLVPLPSPVTLDLTLTLTRHPSPSTSRSPSRSPSHTQAHTLTRSR